MSKLTYVFGHRKPDTDSVTSAIALSFLKNALGFETKPVILDDINNETKFVLDYFGVEVPDFLNDVKLQVKDIEYYTDCYMYENSTIQEAYDYMKNNNITGVPLVDRARMLKGLITVKMIGNELINGDYTHLVTSYDNIVKTLRGEEVLKFDNEIDGNIVAAAFKSTTILNDISFDRNNILIVGDRHSIIEYAVNSAIQLIILVGNHEIKEEHLKIAKENKVNIIKTSFDTFHTARTIGFSGYVKNLLSSERIERIQPDEYYDNFVALSSKQGYNNYPLVSQDGVCLGLIRVTDIKKKHKKKVILVDHNESAQSAIGLDEAEVLEIVDHHKLGDLTTTKPINFRNMTVGSTNTIIFMMYKETNIRMPKKIAGIMMAGIISDTVCLTSPTTTEQDKVAVEELATIAGVDVKEFSQAMFKAGTKLEGKSKEEILVEDMKVFPINDKKIAISQILTLNAEEILKDKEEYAKIMDSIAENKEYDVFAFCVTDINDNGSYLMYSEKSHDILKETLDIEIYQGIYLPGIVSRKKQFVPMVMKYLKRD